MGRSEEETIERTGRGRGGNCKASGDNANLVCLSRHRVTPSSFESNMLLPVSRPVGHVSRHIM
eukprot:6194815-Pleurochrysis_carterae.AAC.1